MRHDYYFWKEGAIDSEPDDDPHLSWDEAEREAAERASAEAVELAEQLAAGNAEAAPPHPGVHAFRAELLDLRPTLAGAIRPDPPSDRYVIVDLASSWYALVDAITLARRHQLSMFDPLSPENFQ